MATCRIDAIVAREAPRAVVFRRGPSKLTQLLTWDLESDEVVAGQWIKGRVYTRRCDVSPNGKYLIAGFTNYGSRDKESAERFKLKEPWMTSGWTAISRPPFFTALALWFTGSAWNGGGLWQSDTLVRPNNQPHFWHAAIRPAAHVRVRNLNLGASEDTPIHTMRLERDGWRAHSHLKTRMTNKREFERSNEKARSRWGDILSGNVEALIELAMDLVVPHFEMVRPGLFTKPVPNGELRFEQWLPHDEPYRTHERWSLVRDDGKVVKQWLPKPFQPQFLDVDHRGRVLFGDQGRLMAWERFPKGRPKVVADLNGNTFTPVAPPAWARRW